MSTIRLCPECGKPLPENFSGGCPACALRGALELSGAPVAAEVVVAEKPSDRIGRYKLLQKIGEGGMGTVWMAEQEGTIRRRVALKIIKLGMDTKQVIGRFEAERQALALMDHPNIAKVLDAGATDTGRPFFVMELVKGIPITNYCDDHKLGTEERLKLFTDVCLAIQHAHQKGIIHRDIKPSNILVTHNDGAPMPKVIDFGIAKATGGQTLTDKTVFTAFEQFIGTPAYMSPEQAEMNALDVDTRCDIYALGVLLYELLTGKTPFEAKELLAKGLDELRRVIREQEPPKPSTRLSTLDAAEQTMLASRRHCEPPQLRGSIRGDLDWIVMKCLEKDRSRRYDTVSGLARDIARHLTGQPVTAGAPGIAYRAGKFIRRHRYGFATAISILLLLIVGVIVSTSLAVRESTARADEARQRKSAEAANAQTGLQLKLTQQAEQQARTVSTFLEDMLQSVTPEQAKGRDTTLMLEILDKTAARVDKELDDQPLLQAKLKDTLGNIYHKLGQYQKAEPPLRWALEMRENTLGKEDTNTLTSMVDLARLLSDKRDYAAAEPLCRQVLEAQEHTLGGENPETLASMNNLAVLLLAKEDYANAEPLIRRTLETRVRLSGAEDPDTLTSKLNLANLLYNKGDYTAAEPLFRQVLAVQQHTLGEENPDTLATMNNLAVLLIAKKDYTNAEPLMRQTLELKDRIMGKEHPSTLISVVSLAVLLINREDYTASEPLWRRAQDVFEHTADKEDIGTVAAACSTITKLLVFKEGKSGVEAVTLFHKTMEQGLAGAQYELGCFYRAGTGVTKDYAEAVKWYRKAADHNYPPAQCDLGFCYANGQGVAKDGAEAAKWYRKAADQNFTNAQYNLGVCYANGQGVAKDEVEALTWYRKAAEQNFAIAQYSVGLCFWGGQGVARDYEEAVKWYRKAADQNYAEAQRYLGVCYANGQGVAKDEVEAVKCYRKAAEQHNATAQRNLGDCYANGQGVAKDEAEAAKWYGKALELDPQNADLLRLCGEASARAGHWKAAAADYAKLTEIQPANHLDYQSLAPLLVQRGDLAVYRRLCHQALAQFGGTADPVIAAQVAQACLLLPASGVDLKTSAALAETAVNAGNDRPDLVNSQFAKGLAEYRQGNINRAVDWMDKVLLKPENPCLEAEASLVLAMARQQHRRFGLARATLARAISIQDQNLPKLESGDLGDSWSDWLAEHALMKEATDLIQSRE